MNGPRTIACLAGAGVGPELMGEASRVLAEVARLHGVGIDDVHLPFGAEAVTRCGHPLPPATRAGYRDVEAILVASPTEPAFEGVLADVDPAWQVARVQTRPGDDLLAFGPFGPYAEAAAVAHAFEAAAARHGHVTSVGTSAHWRDAVEAERERRAPMRVEHATPGELLVRLRDAPHRLHVVVAEGDLGSAIADAAAHLAGTTSTTARGWVSEGGRGMFAPAVSQPDAVAGFGVADPAGMLLTVALLLSEGLGRRSAARTLERAVVEVVALNGAGPSGTREFTDAVIERLPAARTDTELFDEVWAA
jgi:3-isopropylmalate dehydrogenase